MGILDDDYDPIGGLGRLPGLGGGDARPPRAAYRKPLPPEQFKSVGQHALDTGASGLNYALGTLDKPGQAVRGVLAGHGAASLKHLIPFGESLGITGPADHVSGRDLTDMYGITDKHDKGWGSWGAGLAADLVTDPLSYTTFGAKHALTGVGKAVQKTGALKGLSGRAMIEGFHGVEPAMLAAGQTASDVTHAIDQGKRIASPAVQLAAEAADPAYRTTQKTLHKFEVSGPSGLLSSEAATPQLAEAAVRRLINATTTPLLPGQKLIGTATSRIADIAAKKNLTGAPLSGLVRVGVPFGPGVTFGTGKAAQKIAGAMDAAGDYLKFGNPVGRAVGSLFDSSRHGAVDRITQEGAVKYLDPAIQTIKQQERAAHYGLTKELGPLVSAGVHPEETIADAARAAAEGVTHPFDPALVAQVQPAAGQIRGANSRRLAEARAAGAPLEDLGDPYRQYVHRSALPENPQNLQVGGKKSGMLPVTSGSNIPVDELYRDIPGATHRINDWFGRFAGDPNKAAVEAAVQKDMVADLVAGGGTMTPALAKTFGDKATAMAERLAGSSQARRATATSRGGLFTPDLIADEAQRGAQAARTVSSSRAAIGILGDNARPITPGDGMIPLSAAMKKIGLKTYKADQAAGTPMEGALVQMYRALAKPNQELGRAGVGKVDPFLMGKMKPLRGAVDQFGITPEHLDQITRTYGKWAAPEPIKAPIKALDSFTNAFKALAYPIWIPAHVRNAFTASVNNATRGTGLQDYAKQLRVMTGRGINPADADAIRGAQYASANIFGGHGMNEEIAGNVQSAIRDGKRFTPNVPGSDRAGPTGNVVGDTANLVLNEGLLGSLGAGARTLRDSVGGLFDPTRRWGQSLGENLGIKGVGGAAKDTLPAVSAGRKAGTNIEDFFRGAQWNKEVRSGATPEVAGDAVNHVHFDYDALTDFEKNFMRRAVPFYTFARKNLPLQLETALHTPGVINAQYRPFNQEGPDDKGYIPQYLSGGVAVPLGPERDGKRQYLSKLGLPAEEAFERLHFKNGLPDLGATALDYAGMGNPLIKGIAEQLSGTQFHTGRRLSDLKATGLAGTIGRAFGDDNPQALGQLMANSPFTRFFSSADKLLDDRKSWGQKLLNLGTGVKVTDVDVDKQRAIDTRNALEGIMQGHPNLSRYSSFYVKPEDVKDLTPEEIEMMRAYSEIQANAKAYAKQKRERIGVR